MKRTYTTPTAAIINLGDDLMRQTMTHWSLGRVTRKDDVNSDLWNTIEVHPAQEAQDWRGRLNTADDAWGTDIWGESE